MLERDPGAADGTAPTAPAPDSALSRLPAATQRRIRELRGSGGGDGPGAALTRTTWRDAPEWVEGPTMQQVPTLVFPAPPAPPPGPTLVQLIDLLWRRKLLVVLALLVAAATGYAAGSLVDARFEATAVLQVLDDRIRTGALGGAVPPTGATATEIAGVAESTSTLEAAGLGEGSGAAVSTGTDDTGAVTLRVAAPTRDDAVAGAGRLADATIETYRARVAAELGQVSSELLARAGSLGEQAAVLAEQLAGLRAQLAGLQATPPSAERDAAVARLTEDVAGLERQRDAALDEQLEVSQRATELEIEARVGDGGLRVVVPPDVAVDVTRPKPLHLAVLGAGLAFLLLLGAGYVRLALAAARHDR